jgi:hypothetical protein
MSGTAAEGHTMPRPSIGAAGTSDTLGIRMAADIMAAGITTVAAMTAAATIKASTIKAAVVPDQE